MDVVEHVAKKEAAAPQVEVAEQVPEEEPTQVANTVVPNKKQKVEVAEHVAEKEAAKPQVEVAEQDATTQQKVVKQPKQVAGQLQESESHGTEDAEPLNEVAEKIAKATAALTKPSAAIGFLQSARKKARAAQQAGAQQKKNNAGAQQKAAKAGAQQKADAPPEATVPPEKKIKTPNMSKKASYVNTWMHVKTLHIWQFSRLYRDICVEKRTHTVLIPSHDQPNNRQRSRRLQNKNARNWRESWTSASGRRMTKRVMVCKRFPE